jgi:hypothetical protein
MGYRNYIAPITKIEYERIKNFTKEELYKEHNEDLEDGYVGVYDIADDSIYELGKYVEEFDKELFKPVFLNDELQTMMTQEHDFYIVDKNFMKAVIDRYNNYIKDYYNKMCLPFFPEKFKSSEFLNTLKREIDEESEDLDFNYSFDFDKITQPEINAFRNIIDHVRSMWTEWCRLTPYNLDNGDAVTTSWKYEYAQFELVRIYKNFDWGNNLMIYYGY